MRVHWCDSGMRGLSAGGSPQDDLGFTTLKHNILNKPCKNCECCHNWLSGTKDCHEFSFSIVRTVINSVSNVTSLQDCLFKIVKNCLNCLSCQKLSKIVKNCQNCQKLTKFYNANNFDNFLIFLTMTMIILDTCGLWTFEYNSDNWEAEFRQSFLPDN